MSSEQPAILFVDDEKYVLTSLQRNLIREPFRKFFASSAREGLELLEHESIQVVISDMRMPEMDGLTFLRKVRELYPDIVRMVLSGTAEISGVVEAINSGEVYRYLTKPLSELVEFHTILHQALEYYDLQQSRRKLVAELEENNRILSRWRERIAHELELAAQVQRRILATHPLLGMDFTVHVAYQPCLSIGGDFYDVISWPDGRLCVYIGDVAGHGVGSAMLSTLLKVTTSDLIRAHAQEGPAAICRKLNAFVFNHIHSDDFFATFFIAFYDPEQAQWRACNCGHHLPLLLASDGQCLPDSIPDVGDIPIGIADGDDFFDSGVETTWAARPGETLILFTDGLVEACLHGTDEQCGRTHLSQLATRLSVSDRPLLRPADVLSGLKTEGYDISADDCCAISVRLPPNDEIRIETNIEPTLDAVDALASQCKVILMKSGWSDVAASAAQRLIQAYGANIIQHGRPKKSEQIEFQLSECDGFAYLLFRDCGVQWNFASCLMRAMQQDVFRHLDYNYGYFVLSKHHEDAL